MSQIVTVDAPPSLLTALVASGLRHLLTAVGVVLETYAGASHDQATQIVTAIVGLAPIFASLLWSAIEKHNKINTIKTLSGS